MTSSRKKSRKSKKEHEEPFDPKADMEDIVYETECTVKVITPMTFVDPLEAPPVNKGKDSKGRKTPEKLLNTGKSEGKSESKRSKSDKHGKKKVDSEINLKIENKLEVKPEKPDIKDAIVIQVSMGAKKDHPWSSRITGDQCLVVNRVPGSTLHLERGKKYFFRFIGKAGAGHEMIFTRDPVGGKSSPLLEGTAPIPIGGNGLITLTKDCPNLVYYQDRNHEFLGGMMYIK
jgi:hypothetical protein